MNALRPDVPSWNRQASYQKFFGEAWIAFLTENFHSPEQIGCAFGVTAQTARNWLSGVTAPRAPFVALALTSPDTEASARKHLTRAA